ncbi:hypothetical protein BCF55_0137 [Hydrogenivirga caldilitoris]|uniref:Calcineurin-like phosphoesterase domain-containing protein n=1 Tax=Hydrogenivirga caldilitoris TaxID=246264 RepID=A0A497XP21_9AQUI|nr:metallophosphoesterase [Hydrogenivirga caldilitoris]RLJ69880.1 hypothetical protein BCF55_0137 [Hydrogenivirga caldilitoris]
MRLFIPVFFIIYSLVHYYAYRKLCQAFEPVRVQRLFVLTLFALTTLSPAIWRFLDRNGETELSRPLAFFSLFWMGFIIYFFLIGILIDLYRKFHSPGPREAFFLTLFLTLLVSAYSHAETYFLQVERYVIETPKLPKGVEIKIMNASDLHLGPVMREDKIEMVRKVYERERPDILVATGDTVDGNMRDSEELAEMLSSINPPLGKFAVVGNHEYYAGLEQSLSFLERAGFKVLRGEIIEVKGLLNLAGVDDPDGEKLGYRVFTDEVEVLKGADTSRYTILLKHRPEVKREAIPHLDLVIAGHTHGGVLFFVGYTVLRLIYETDRGIKELAPGKFIVVSKGVGTGGPPMRLLSPPDVVIVTLRGLSQ